MTNEPMPEVEHAMADAAAAQERCRCAMYGADECEEHTAEPSRFFVDHGVIHDRKSSRHVTCLPPLHNELVKRILESPYHRPPPGRPELATEAYALSVLLIIAYLEQVALKATLESTRRHLAASENARKKP